MRSYLGTVVAALAAAAVALSLVEVAHRATRRLGRRSLLLAELTEHAHSRAARRGRQRSHRLRLFRRFRGIRWGTPRFRSVSGDRTSGGARPGRSLRTGLTGGDSGHTAR
ncbi:hypothetical protein GA0070621_0730 [Micromonospora narathiwatensis]|uniref:Uncharacterized protein n=1 Tax=Micromonospora narathiwatensis TaxID=299146 RepID=A0A1A8Z752_9ACTN|nr:hypothetical protein GA0070621_0730 [Micromonospora narathiwatensis]